MKRIPMMLAALAAALGMAACAAGPKNGPADRMDSAGIRMASDFSTDEEELVPVVIRKMLDATAPEPKSMKDDGLFAAGAMTVVVTVYDQKIYDAAVAIVRACRGASR